MSETPSGTERTVSRRTRKIEAQRVDRRDAGAWVRLAKSTVDARAGLIPSEEIDADPPPDGLTCRELLGWHAGLPVFLSAERFVESFGTPKVSPWQRRSPTVVKVVKRLQHRADRSRRAR